MPRAAWMRALFALVSINLAGCVSYESERQRIDADIPDMSTLQQISLGETTTEWLVAEFGQPSAVRRPSEAIAVWQYQNVTSSMTRVRALPLFAMEMKDQSRTVYNFEIENNYIVRYWKDATE